MQLSTANYAPDVVGIFEDAGDVDVAVAFVSEPGLDLIRPTLLRKLEASNRVRLLMDPEAGTTNPTVLRYPPTFSGST